MTDKPRTWRLHRRFAEPFNVDGPDDEREHLVIELEPVLDLLGRVVTTTSVDGCRTLQGDIEALLREHGRL